jgi:hypothetical protein
MGALRVAQLGKVEFSVGEDLTLRFYTLVDEGGKDGGTYLIVSSKLEVDFKVLLIERLKERVEHSTKERTVDLLDDFRTCLPRISTGRDGCQLELIEVVVLRVLVGGTDDESDEVEGEVEGAEDGGEEESVVIYASVDEGDGSLQVVQEGVNVCLSSQRSTPIDRWVD